MNSEFFQSQLIGLWGQVIQYLPRLLSGLLVLAAGWLLGRILAFLLRRLLGRLGVDALVERSGLAESLRRVQIVRPVSEILSLVVFWLVFLNFLLIALENLGLSGALQPLQSLIGFLPRILASILILVAGALLAQFLGQAVRGALAGMGVEFDEVLGQAVKVLLLAVAVVLAVEQLGFNIELLTDTFTNLLTILAAGFVLAFALGGRDVARNVLAGYYARELFELGDQIEVDDLSGTLEAIGALNAEFAANGDRVVVPNARLLESRVTVRGMADRSSS